MHSARTSSWWHAHLELSSKLPKIHRIRGDSILLLPDTTNLSIYRYLLFPPLLNSLAVNNTFFCTQTFSSIFEWLAQFKFKTKCKVQLHGKDIKLAALLTPHSWHDDCAADRSHSRSMYCSCGTCCSSFSRRELEKLVKNDKHVGLNYLKIYFCTLCP